MPRWLMMLRSGTRRRSSLLLAASALPCCISSAARQLCDLDADRGRTNGNQRCVDTHHVAHTYRLAKPHCVDRRSRRLASACGQQCWRVGARSTVSSSGPAPQRADARSAVRVRSGSDPRNERRTGRIKRTQRGRNPCVRLRGRGYLPLSIPHLVSRRERSDQTQQLCDCPLARGHCAFVAARLPPGVAGCSV